MTAPSASWFSTTLLVILYPNWVIKENDGWPHFLCSPHITEPFSSPVGTGFFFLLGKKVVSLPTYRLNRTQWHHSKDRLSVCTCLFRWYFDFSPDLGTRISHSCYILDLMPHNQSDLSVIQFCSSVLTLSNVSFFLAPWERVGKLTNINNE